jgi:transketolase
MRDTKDIPFMRDALMASVNDLAAVHEEIVFLDADLSSCIGSESFQKLYPGRFYNCGIAEANMVAVAAGLSSMGLVPFVHSFGCFASRRAFDQFFISAGYAHQVIHLIGSDPGVLAQYNGGTHMPFEDIALMRQVPGVVIIDPSDKQSMYALTQQLYESGKLSYTRSGRKTSTQRYTPDTKIQLGKGIVLDEGEDVGIIATGEVMVNAATEAVKLLSAKGIKTTLVDLHTIRPLDTELITSVAKKTGHLLICENGRYSGGVGEEIAAFLAKTHPTKMDFVNVGEAFGEVGNLSYLTGRFGFTGPHIAEVAEALAKR